MSTADELKQFKQLLDEGIISQEEFDKEKRNYLVNRTVQIKNLKKPTKKKKIEF